MTQDFVFTLQMDAEAEDKTLRTRAKGTKGELACRFRAQHTVKCGHPMLGP